ncbi:gamma-aminobutyric acid type B receptor subunit 2-like [Tropilaelaps mercedesae]|uniref:Gamma-aminobutyric acid type B receptor subunit 2-like n=1 Tax=Tropilaelaps mercedesae TaxID=418985 RepID=A0A1V9XAQ9_9ACAR|nr:gamma-aminobutyric acid type B receptor subunit 2-like [Tropilaelaps mercedesae]
MSLPWDLGWPPSRHKPANTQGRHLHRWCPLAVSGNPRVVAVNTLERPASSRCPYTLLRRSSFVQILLVQLLSLSLSTFLCVSCAHGVDLHIAGFFPTTYNLSEGAIGRGVVPAVNLALEHLNNATQFLPGYTLAIQWNDTQVGTRSAV